MRGFFAITECAATPCVGSQFHGARRLSLAWMLCTALTWTLVANHRACWSLFLLTDSGCGCPEWRSNVTKWGVCGFWGMCFTTKHACCAGEGRVSRPLDQRSTRRPSSFTPHLETDNSTMYTSKKTSQTGIPVPCASA